MRPEEEFLLKKCASRGEDGRLYIKQGAPKAKAFTHVEGCFSGPTKHWEALEKGGYIRIMRQQKSGRHSSVNFLLNQYGKDFLFLAILAHNINLGRFDRDSVMAEVTEEKMLGGRLPYELVIEP